MYTCQECAELIWDSLYDLLDADQVQALRAHVAECPACQAVQAEAEAQQKRIARAAQVYDQVPLFQKPAEEETGRQGGRETRRQEEKETVPFTPRRWPWVAAAAAILLMIAGGYGWYQHGLSQYESVV